MNREKFLEKLRAELEEKDYKNTNEVIEYYDELILEKVDLGTAEKTVIKDLGKIDDIVSAVILEDTKFVDKNKNSNGTKNALLVVFGILSLPISIPLVSLLFVLVLVMFIVLFSIMLVVASITLTSVVGVIALFPMIIHGLSIPAFMILLGILILLFTGSLVLFKLIWKAIKKFYNFVKRKINEKKEKSAK